MGDDYGKPTDHWIGVAFPNGSPPTTAGALRENFYVDIPASVPDSTLLAVYPTQLFETSMALLIFLYLWSRRDRPHQTGWLFGIWMILAGVERFAIEFLRAKDDRFFGPLTTAQLISLALMGLGLYVVLRRRVARGSRTSAAV